MSYHIIRSESWQTSLENPIVLEEWLMYIQRDIQLVREGVITGKAGPEGEQLRDQNFGFALWRGRPDHTDHYMTLQYHQGRIIVDEVDDQGFQKMIEVARLLGARVVDEENAEASEKSIPLASQVVGG